MEFIHAILGLAPCVRSYAHFIWFMTNLSQPEKTLMDVITDLEDVWRWRVTMNRQSTRPCHFEEELLHPIPQAILRSACHIMSRIGLEGSDLHSHTASA
jgi:hypothetical protein